MLVPKKVQLHPKDIKIMDEICSAFAYKSQSEYMRLAILEKIKTDKKALRERKRKKAMQSYQMELEDCFASLQGEDFENR